MSAVRSANILHKTIFMKQLFTILLLILIGGKAFSTNYYQHQKLVGPYVPLTGDTLVPLITTSSNQGVEYLLPLKGEVISMFGQNYAIDDSLIFLYFSTNGHLGIHTDTSFIILDGLFTYLDSIDITSGVSYKIDGTGSNRVVKIQYKNLKLRAGPTNNWADMQIWFYLSTSIVEMHYGPSSVNNASGYTTVNGPNIGLFHSNSIFTSMFEKIWLNGNPSNYTIDSAQNFVFNAMLGVPAEGTIYRFIPKHLSLDAQTLVKKTGVTAYPTPAHNRLSLRGTINTNYKFEISDPAGRVTSSGYFKTQIDLDVSGWAAGVYAIAVSERDFHQKIMVLKD